MNLCLSWRKALADELILDDELSDWVQSDDVKSTMSQEGEATIWLSAEMGWKLYSFIQNWGQAQCLETSSPFKGFLTKPMHIC